MKRKLGLVLLSVSSALLVAAQSVGAKGPLDAPPQPELTGRDPDAAPPASTVSQASRPESLPVASGPSSPSEFRITQASRQHDFRVLMSGGCTKLSIGSDICEGPATLTILGKGTATETQRLTFPSLSIVRSANNEVLVNSVALYDFQGSLVLDDFNFDGYEDLAVQTGQDGPYGGPTFDVFLYRARQGRFELSEPLSALTQENLGLFEVIPARKRIATFAKGGCCYHVTQQYEFVGTKPVLVARYIEDATGADGILTQTSESLVKGRWVRTVRRERWSSSGHDW
jgi:hypothetical protein